MLFDFLPDWNCLLNVVTQTPSNQGWEKCPLLEALEGFDKFAKNPSNPPLQPFNYKTSRFCRRPCTSLSTASIKEGFKKMKFFIINLFWSERESKMALKSQPFLYIYSVICIQHTYVFVFLGRTFHLEDKRKGKREPMETPLSSQGPLIPFVIGPCLWENVSPKEVIVMMIYH